MLGPPVHRIATQSTVSTTCMDLQARTGRGEAALSRLEDAVRSLTSDVTALRQEVVEAAPPTLSVATPPASSQQQAEGKAAQQAGLGLGLGLGLEEEEEEEGKEEALLVQRVVCAARPSWRRDVHDMVADAVSTAISAAMSTTTVPSLTAAPHMHMHEHSSAATGGGTTGVPRGVPASVAASPPGMSHGAGRRRHHHHHRAAAAPPQPPPPPGQVANSNGGGDGNSNGNGNGDGKDDDDHLAGVRHLVTEAVRTEVERVVADVESRVAQQHQAAAAAAAAAHAAQEAQQAQQQAQGAAHAHTRGVFPVIDARASPPHLVHHHAGGTHSVQVGHVGVDVGKHPTAPSRARIGAGASASASASASAGAMESSPPPAWARAGLVSYDEHGAEASDARVHASPNTSSRTTDRAAPAPAPAPAPALASASLDEVVAQAAASATASAVTSVQPHVVRLSERMDGLAATVAALAGQVTATSAQTTHGVERMKEERAATSAQVEALGRGVQRTDTVVRQLAADAVARTQEVATRVGAAMEAMQQALTSDMHRLQSEAAKAVMEQMGVEDRLAAVEKVVTAEEARSTRCVVHNTTQHSKHMEWWCTHTALCVYVRARACVGGGGGGGGVWCGVVKVAMEVDTR